MGVQLGPITAEPHVFIRRGVGGRPRGQDGSKEGSREEVLRAMGLDPVKLY